MNAIFVFFVLFMSFLYIRNVFGITISEWRIYKEIKDNITNKK